MATKQIGAAVRKARGERSVRQVAEAAGLHRDQVAGIEAGTKAYTINSLLALCRVVGLRLAFQAKGSEAHSTNSSDGTDGSQG